MQMRGTLRLPGYRNRNHLSPCRRRITVIFEGKSMQQIFTPESIENRLAQFSDRVIAHPALESVFKDLRTVIRRPGEIPLIVAVGPSGVGKTTLVKRLHREILADSEKAM